MRNPQALILMDEGINCNVETAHAFEDAGADAVQVHISELDSGQVQLSEFDILGLSGGFSHGDAIRSGAILGTKLRERYAEDLNRFVAMGKPVVGICNGFQVLVEAGLLPTGTIDPSVPKQISLIHNQSGKFECRWPSVEVGRSACRYLPKYFGGTIHSLPVANGEGRLVAPGLKFPESQIVLKYIRPDGTRASYPDDPNGSIDGITAICDPSGVVLGMMPHPERAIRAEQHPGWRRNPGLLPFGAAIFHGIVEHAKSI